MAVRDEAGASSRGVDRGSIDAGFLIPAPTAFSPTHRSVFETVTDPLAEGKKPVMIDEQINRD